MAENISPSVDPATLLAQLLNQAGFGEGNANRQMLQKLGQLALSMYELKESCEEIARQFGIIDGELPPLGLSFMGHPDLPGRYIFITVSEAIDGQYVFAHNTLEPHPLSFARLDQYLAALPAQNPSPEDFFQAFDKCPRLKIGELAPLLVRGTLPHLRLQ